MKKLLLITALFVAAVGAHAQNQNAIKINPLSLILATGNIAYERAIGKTTSVQLGMFYTGVGIGDFKYSGLGITPEVRFYIAGRKEALNGVYVGPYLRYQNFTIKDKEDGSQVAFNSFGGGAVLGWEKSWPSGFVLDLFVGPAYNSGTVKSKNGSDPDEFDVSSGFDGFGIRSGITLGFSF
jgi:hypothetical protein